MGWELPAAIALLALCYSKRDQISQSKGWIGLGLFLFLAVYVGNSLIDRFDAASLKGKRVVLTGGSTGIGEQMAYHYARMGAKVLITARRENRLKEVIEKCKKEGDPDGDYQYFVADMANLNSTQALIQYAVDSFGGIDFLVLNHILIHPMGEWTGSSQNLSLLDQLLAINTKAYVHLASHALPRLEESAGSIVVVTSIAGRVAQPYVIAYSASKFALDGFFGGLRQELQMKGSGVSVTQCVIGLIGTENALKALQGYGLNMLLKYIPASKPEDAALAIIKGGVSRQREIYFPAMARVSVLIRDIMPDALLAFNQWIYTRS